MTGRPGDGSPDEIRRVSPARAGCVRQGHSGGSPLPAVGTGLRGATVPGHAAIEGASVPPAEGTDAPGGGAGGVAAAAPTLHETIDRTVAAIEAEAARRRAVIAELERVRPIAAVIVITAAAALARLREAHARRAARIVTGRALVGVS